MADPQAAETFGFQAEVKQLLHLMVHSLYSEREIFRIIVDYLLEASGPTCRNPMAVFMTIIKKEMLKNQ